jgi:hypothetical protein
LQGEWPATEEKERVIASLLESCYTAAIRFCRQLREMRWGGIAGFLDEKYRKRKGINKGWWGKQIKMKKGCDHDKMSSQPLSI